ncbi:major capsid protein [Xanthomonas arboricola]|uniref:major capsid protein n=1 Tax=Xanthomonas arboricola TaxID=56448 RepID=UPI000CEF521B|nr:major capsid protein [Xanthomonas arboricola]PPT26879.1 major capsid protein E [Xanthomonas arboricola]
MDLQTLLALGVLSPGALNAYVNNLPATPTRIAQLGLFTEAGLVGTNIVKVGINGAKLVLVPNVPRGAPAQPKALTRGNVRIFETAHLPQRSTVMADELLNVVRDDDPAGESVAAVINALQVIHRRDVDYTIEYHRIGAIRGQVLDADGSVIWDMYDEFGVEQITIPFGLGTDATKVRSKSLAVKRAIELELGGVPYNGVRALCSPEFFDALIDHKDVRDAYARWQDGAALRNDVRAGFELGGVVYEEMVGGLGNQPFIPAGEALAFPLGVPDMFITRFAPADYMETVKGIGLPYYTKLEPLRMNKGVDMESQSNPINLNTRPRAVIRLKASGNA